MVELQYVTGNMHIVREFRPCKSEFWIYKGVEIQVVSGNMYAIRKFRLYKFELRVNKTVEIQDLRLKILIVIRKRDVWFSGFLPLVN